MKLAERIVNAIRSRTNGRPKPGRVVLPRAEDSVRDYPGAGLTPSRLVAILREADDGSLATAMQLFEEMEEKDAHLFSIANTRRLALTGLKWQIVSAADVREGTDRRLASLFSRGGQAKWRRVAFAFLPPRLQSSPPAC